MIAYHTALAKNVRQNPRQRHLGIFSEVFPLECCENAKSHAFPLSSFCITSTQDQDGQYNFL